MNSDGVVMTGMGVVSALAASLKEHYPLLLAGRSGIVKRVIDPPDDLPVSAWAQAPHQLVSQRITQRMLRKLLQPSAAMAVVAAGEALKDAGLEQDFECLEQTGLYIGSVSFDLPPSQFVPAIEVSIGQEGGFDLARFATRGMAQMDPLIIVKGLPNAGLCGIAIEHGVLGPNLNIANGSVGGAQALGAAAAAIWRGDVQVALAGGYDSLLQPEHIVAELLGGRLSNSDNNNGQSSAGGYVVGEGAAICVLESEEHARRRGAKIYTKVVAAEETSGGADSLSDALEKAARQALDKARMDERSCFPQIIFGDLLGIQPDDAREMMVAAHVLGESAAITGAVGALGFTGASCGVFSVVHAARAIAEGRVPPTVNRPTDNQHRGPRVIAEAEARPLTSALVWRSDHGMRNVAIVLASMDA
jgi:3-oxoacyl-[acyl-carrier-protein] synthase II